MSHFRLVHYAIYHEDEPEKAYCWCHLDTTDAKDVGIEVIQLVASAKHQQKAYHNHRATDAHKREIDFCERKITIFYLLFFAGLHCLIFSLYHIIL